MSTSKRIPDRYHSSVIPHIMVNGASRAIAFYEKALGATEIFRIVRPDNRIVHAEMRIGESVIMVGDADGPFRDPTHFTVHRLAYIST